MRDRRKCSTIFEESLIALSRAVCGKFLLLTLLLFLNACTLEVDTKVSVVGDSNPPAFKLAGTGARPFLTVRGPYALNDKAEKEKPIWAITTDDSLAHSWISDLPLITYGKLPDHFKQVYPESGDAPKLEEGMFYNVYVQVLSAEGSGTCFGIQNGKVISCP